MATHSKGVMKELKRLAKKDIKLEKGKENLTVEGVKSNIVEVVGIKLKEMADFILTRSSEILIANDSVDTGFLMRSGEIHHEEDLKYTLIYTAPYSAVVEFGARPHFVSAKVLFGWVKRKIGITNEKKAWGIAYAISKSIGRRGQEPRPYLRPAIEQAVSKFGI